MGKYGKGLLNSSGRMLLELLAKHDLFLTNTIFKHNLAHQTTWTAPERKDTLNSFDGTPRRNPYRNQIDYIITKCRDNMFVQDSRSYGGTTTSTDHKLVKANISFTWWKKKELKSTTSKSI